MSSTISQPLDVTQFREVAGRLASLLQTTHDRAGTLNQFIEAMSSAETFTDLLIAYAGRWFTEASGQPALVGPEMFWQLSAPDTRTGSVIADASPYTDATYGAGERARKMLLICLFESFAQNQWPSGIGEPRASVNGLG